MRRGCTASCPISRCSVSPCRRRLHGDASPAPARRLPQPAALRRQRHPPAQWRCRALPRHRGAAPARSVDPLARRRPRGRRDRGRARAGRRHRARRRRATVAGRRRLRRRGARHLGHGTRRQGAAASATAVRRRRPRSAPRAWARSRAGTCWWPTTRPRSRPRDAASSATRTSPGSSARKDCLVESQFDWDVVADAHDESHHLGPARRARRRTADRRAAVRDPAPPRLRGWPAIALGAARLAGRGAVWHARRLTHRRAPLPASAAPAEHPVPLPE